MAAALINPPLQEMADLLYSQIALLCLHLSTKPEMICKKLQLILVLHQHADLLIIFLLNYAVDLPTRNVN